MVYPLAVNSYWSLSDDGRGWRCQHGSSPIPNLAWHLILLVWQAVQHQVQWWTSFFIPHTKMIGFGFVLEDS